jgi:hypothetical protein
MLTTADGSVLTSAIEALLAAQDAVDAARLYRDRPEVAVQHRTAALAQLDLAIAIATGCRAALAQPAAPDRPAEPPPRPAAVPQPERLRKAARGPRRGKQRTATL